MMTVDSLLFASSDSGEFYKSWYVVLQYMHLALFGALLFTKKWRTVSFPLMASSVFYIGASPLLGALEAGHPLSFYFVCATIDTTVMLSVLALGWRAGSAGWKRQSVLLALFGLINAASGVEFTIEGVFFLYDLYLPVTMALNVLQILVMYDAVADIRTIPRTIARFHSVDMSERILRAIGYPKGS